MTAGITNRGSEIIIGGVTYSTRQHSQTVSRYPPTSLYSKQYELHKVWITEYMPVGE